MIEKYFSDFFFLKKFNKNWQKCLNWINLKLKVLKRAKLKLEDWNGFRKNLKNEFYILAKKKLKLFMIATLVNLI